MSCGLQSRGRPGKIEQGATSYLLLVTDMYDKRKEGKKERKIIQPPEEMYDIAIEEVTFSMRFQGTTL